MYVVCIAIVLHGTSTSTIEPMYGVAYSTSSVPVPSISVLSAKYVIVEGNYSNSSSLAI